MKAVFRKSDGVLCLVSDTLTNEILEAPDEYEIVDDFNFNPSHTYSYVDGAVVDNGVYVMTAEEQAHYAQVDVEYALEQLREERNKLLAESDWTQAVDSPLDDATKAAWQTYRQALRDITETYSSLDDAVFPEKP